MINRRHLIEQLENIGVKVILLAAAIGVILGVASNYVQIPILLRDFVLCLVMFGIAQNLAAYFYRIRTERPFECLFLLGIFAFIVSVTIMDLQDRNALSIAIVLALCAATLAGVNWIFLRTHRIAGMAKIN